MLLYGILYLYAHKKTACYQKWLKISLNLFQTQDILKPNYNTVDLSEIELVDKDDVVRNHDKDLMDVRFIKIH